MSLRSIYRTVEADLTSVDELLMSIKSDGSVWLDEMLAYSLESGGKRIRPALTLLVGKLHEYRLERLLPMAASIELMHTATLIHDDAIDKSAVRRTKRTAYNVWGEDKAILLGDFLFAKAGEMATDTKSLQAVKLFTRTLAIISTGEVNQSFSAFDINQTREQYLQRIAHKTAALFALSTESGGLLSEAPPAAICALREYGYHLGIAFQITDDILDFTSTAKSMGKPIVSDLAQGTLTLPSMMILERYPEDNPVKHLFKNHDHLSEKERQTLINEAREIVRSSSIVEDCRRVASEYSQKACESLEILPSGIIRNALEKLARFILTRRK
ncbi:MAG: polyprenyl synthetase family protein [Dehalococcoidales bacterium]